MPESLQNQIASSLNPSGQAVLSDSEPDNIIIELGDSQYGTGPIDTPAHKTTENTQTGTLDQNRFNETGDYHYSLTGDTVLTNLYQVFLPGDYDGQALNLHNFDLEKFKNAEK